MIDLVIILNNKKFIKYVESTAPNLGQDLGQGWSSV